MRKTSSTNISFSKLYQAKIILAQLLFILLPCLLFSQNSTTYRVFLKDKGPDSFFPGTALFEKTMQLHNERSKKRRAKHLVSDSLFTIEDAPVYSQYISEIENLNIKILLKLRWKNYLVVQADSNEILTIASLPFVKSAQRTGEKMSLLSSENSISLESIFEKEIITSQFISNCGELDYGLSYLQASLLNIPTIHSFGINGKGVLVGIIDAGFSWRNQRALLKTNVVAEYDFVNSDSITSDQPQDAVKQDNHGTSVLSTIAGFLPGELIGNATGADFILAKTENSGYEKRIEEDNYSAAIEWMESMGVDICSSSLGYGKYDPTDSSVVYEDLNGKSTISAQAVNRAVKLGVICVSAAGNKGPAIHSIMTPSDADSVIAVGALIKDGIRPAGFTSIGPRPDGVNKPDISALGVDVIATNSSGLISKQGGTSLSTPQIAGSLALILSTFPELKTWEARRLLLSTGAIANHPDSIIGSGLPDVYKAMLRAGIIISPISTYQIKIFQRVVLFIASTNFISKAVIMVKFSNDATFREYHLYKTSYENQYAADLPIELFNNKIADCFIIADDGFRTRRMPYEVDSLLSITPGITDIACGVDINKMAVTPDNKSEALLYPSVVYNNSQTIILTVPLEQRSFIEIKVFDINSRLAYRDVQPEREAGIAQISLPIRNLASGNYFVIVNYSGKTDKLHFVKVK